MLPNAMTNRPPLNFRKAARRESAEQFPSVEKSIRLLLHLRLHCRGEGDRACRILRKPFHAGNRKAFLKERTCWRRCPAHGGWSHCVEPAVVTLNICCACCEDDALCAARGLKTPCPIDVLYTGKILFKGQHSGLRGPALLHKRALRHRDRGDSKKVLETTGVSLAHLPASSPTVQCATQHDAAHCPVASAAFATVWFQFDGQRPLLEIHMDVERTVELIRRGLHGHCRISVIQRDVACIR